MQRLAPELEDLPEGTLSADLCRKDGTMVFSLTAHAIAAAERHVGDDDARLSVIVENAARLAMRLASRFALASARWNSRNWSNKSK